MIIRDRKIIILVIAVVAVVGIIGLISADVIDTTVMEGYIGKQKAFEIAQEKIGFSDPVEYWVKLIDHDGKKIYQVTVHLKNGSIWSTYVDAKTGEMVSR